MMESKARSIVQVHNRLNPWYEANIMTPLGERSSESEVQILAWLVIRSCRISQSCVFLDNGNGREHGHFGDIAITLLRVAVESFVNNAYLFDFLYTTDRAQFQNAICRFYEYADLQLLKTANKASEVWGDKFVSIAERSGDYSSRLTELKAIKSDFKAKYGDFEAFPQSLPGRLELVRSSHSDFLNREILELCQAYIPGLNSYVHSDASNLRSILQPNETGTREQRLDQGDQAVTISTLLSINSFRIAANYLGKIDELVEHEKFEFERAQCFEATGYFR